MKLKHHFNLIFDCLDGVTSGNPAFVREAEITLANCARSYLERGGEDRHIEVTYVETFDADLEEMGGASSEQLKAEK